MNMTNKENARFYAGQLKEEIGMSEHSIERVSGIIGEALNEKDRLFSEYLKNKIKTVAENPRGGLLTIFKKRIIIATLELILLDKFNEKYDLHS